jgi:hypothetical protein
MEFYDDTFIIITAYRLARKEGFTPELLSRRKFWEFHAWARAIFDARMPPPVWLAEEDSMFQDYELNRPRKNPNRLSAAKRRKLKHTRFASTIRLTTPLVCFERLPQPDKPPTQEEIEDLGMRLEHDTFMVEACRFPQWREYYRTNPREQERRAAREAQAKRILMGRVAPPEWLVHREPKRWIYKQPINTLPAPSTLKEAEPQLHRQRFPLMAAWIILAASPPPLPKEEPPPADPPPQREAEGRILFLYPPRATEVLLWEINLFDNRIAV